MSQPKKNLFLRIGGKIWRGLEAASRVLLVLLFLAVLVGLVIALRGDTPEVPDSAALVVTPAGRLVEQLAGDPTQRAIDRLTGDDEPETLWRDLDDAIRAAKDDDRIKALFLDLDEMTGSGLSKLQALRATIEEFKTSGKPVIAAADFYLRDAYYLASAADEVFLHEMGMVLLDGYGRYRTYYKQGLDRAEIDWHVFRVGEYKSAVEPFLREEMSPEAREANREWMGDLWRSFLADVAAGRGTTPEELAEGIDGFVERIAAAEGDTAALALAAGLVDSVTGRDGVRDRMIELVGEDEEHHSFHQIGHAAYLRALGDRRRRHPVNGDGVAVVVAKGSILNGSQPPGAIGGDSTARLIRDARHDEAVKAIVLRVDSGGGSAFASEVIRRELELSREAGKKVVVSMGSVAASGGYLISSSSDRILASPNTITGSIGVFGMIPTFQKPMERHLGWRVDGIGTTWLAGAVRPDRALDPELGRAIQMMVDEAYREFIGKVAKNRSKAPEEVDRIARGRVWSGQDALELGLVDELGDLQEAIATAAELAELEEGYAVRFVEKERSFAQKMAERFLTRTADLFAPEHGAARAAPVPALRAGLLELLQREAKLLAMLDDPQGIYALCYCEVD